MAANSEAVEPKAAPRSFREAWPTILILTQDVGELKRQWKNAGLGNGTGAALKQLAAVTPELVEIAQAHRADMELARAKQLVRDDRKARWAARFRWAAKPAHLIGAGVLALLSALEWQAGSSLADFLKHHAHLPH